MLTIKVLRNEVLGIDVVRGYAALSQLSRISQADVYDEKANPNGTQRNLSPKHARDAYEYARTSSLGYWPEVFLCIRDKTVVRYEEVEPGWGKLFIDDGKIEAANHICISRVDGNHRLDLADGHVDGAPPLDRLTSFCMAMDLSLLAEIEIFRDINNNQKSMDTSHLDKIELRLNDEEVIKNRNPPLYIASHLADDPDSPLRSLVYQGGKRPPGSFIPLRTIHTGIEYMLSRQTKLSAIGGADAQVVLIKNYFSALRDWVPEAWSQPKEYLMLRGAGLWGSCFLGADVIDRTLSQKEHSSTEMLKVLRSGRKWDWSRNGDFQGFSGRGGALRIANLIIRDLRDEQGSSMKDLLDQIMNTAKS